MVVGIATVAALSHWKGYRLGGVMVLPLLAIYTFREPLSPLVFVVGTTAAWGALWATREYTLTHGRRVFIVATLTGAAATVVTAYVLAFHTPIHLPFDDAEVVASVFPGVAAYNVMRIDPEERVADAGLMVAVFAGLMLLGVAGLRITDGLAVATPPVLALPTSDLEEFKSRLQPLMEAVTQVTPNWLTVSLLVVDVLVYEWVRSRYDLRLAGIVIIPLLAVFSVRFEHAAAIFAVGATAVFVALSAVHWLSLLYGRVLLAFALVFGSLYALGIGVVTSTALPGLTLFFLGLFVGVAAYNLHRVAPRNRASSLRLSAGLFVAFYAVLVVAVDVPPSGLLSEPRPPYLLAGLLAVGLAVVELDRLERSRPSLSAFAAASVFAEIDVDGADATDSPLVSTDPGPEHRRDSEPQNRSDAGANTPEGKRDGG